MSGLSPLMSWAIFGLLIFLFFIWLLLMAASDADDFWEADERSWLSEGDDDERLDSPPDGSAKPSRDDR